MKNTKSLLIGAAFAIGLIVVLAASTQERVTVTTSAFWRKTLTNETAMASGVAILGSGTGYLYQDGNSNLTWVAAPVAAGTNGIAITSSGSLYTIHWTGIAAYKTLNAIGFTWGGPTNTIDLAAGDEQFYTSPTACQITGIINKNATGTGSQRVLLTLNNSSATNWVLTLPGGIETRDGTRSITVTNGQDRMVWIRYSPLTGKTNSTECANF